MRKPMKIDFTKPFDGPSFADIIVRTKINIACIVRVPCKILYGKTQKELYIDSVSVVSMFPPQPKFPRHFGKTSQYFPGIDYNQTYEGDD